MTRYAFAVLSMLAVHPIIGDDYTSVIVGCSHRATVTFLKESHGVGFGWEPLIGRSRWAFYYPRSKTWSMN